MANLSVQLASLTGLLPVFTAADVAGDAFANNGRTVLHIDNAGATAVTVTIESPQPCSQGFTHDLVVDVPAGESRVVGPFRQDRFNSATGMVDVSYSAVPSVTVAAISQ